jgi:predicted RNA-binding Zn ribbon-like protein
MDQATKRRLGEDLEPGGRAPAPGSLRVVQKFINTHNHEFPEEWDRLGTPTLARAWLVRHGLLEETADISEEERRGLLELREALRSLALRSRGEPLSEVQVELLERAGAKGLRLRFSMDGAPALEPLVPGAAGAALRLLAMVHEANLVEAWGRLKGCRQCGWVFYDRSKNRSAAWCSMSICGNRLKNRAYRRRRAGRAG